MKDKWEDITQEIDVRLVEQSLTNIEDITYKEVTPAPMTITIEVSHEVAEEINNSARKNNTAFELEASMLLSKGLSSLRKTRRLMKSAGGDSLSSTERELLNYISEK